MVQAYGLSGLTNCANPPVGFQSAPTSAQNNYQIGQIAYTPLKNPTAFYVYAGGGSWELFAGSSTGVDSIAGTANQITASASTGAVTLSVPSTFTSPGSVTATLGNITATNGNLSLATAGNKIVIATGSNASVGTSSAMTAGVVTVATTASSATAKIFYSRATTGGTPGNVSITAQDGTGFTLTSTSNTETSTFNYWIINA